MSVDALANYLVPLLYIYFAFRYLRKTAPYMDKDGYSAGRAKESEALWKFAQRAAGLYCLTAGIVLALAAYLISACLDAETQQSVYWYQIGVDVASIALLIPVVNLAMNLKFPKK